MSRRSLPYALRLYAMLLRLYPVAFQRTFAAEMAADAADGYEAAQTYGRDAVARFLLGAYLDVVVTAGGQALAIDRVRILAWSLGAAAIFWGSTVWMLALEWPRGPARALFYWQLAGFFAVLGLAASIAVGRVGQRAATRLDLVTQPGGSPPQAPTPDAPRAPRAAP